MLVQNTPKFILLALIFFLGGGKRPYPLEGEQYKTLYAQSALHTLAVFSCIPEGVTVYSAHPTFLPSMHRL